VYVIEQGEPADALYLILNGTADALLEQPGGQMTQLRRMQAGDFFGELGLVAGERTAHVVARDSLTCLVLSRAPVAPYTGRGAGATSAAGPPPPLCRRGLARWASPATCTANSRRWPGHRTQYPIIPSMLPQSLLQKMLGHRVLHPHRGGIGWEEIRAWGQRVPALVDYLVQTTHPGTIRLDGDTASGRAYLSELIRLQDGSSELNYAI